MSFIDDLAAASNSRRQCTVCKSLIELPPKESAALVDAINNPDISIARIFAACRDNNVVAAKGALTEHRNKRCPKT